jgi:putative tryptophan/tyrosine transport system substrate-binding protein
MGEAMRRREFITVLFGTAVLWAACRAQQPDRMRRIGVLTSVPEKDPEAQDWLDALSEGLSAAWLDGWPQHPARLSLSGAF